MCVGSIGQCDPEIQVELYGQVVLAGGTTLFRGVPPPRGPTSEAPLTPLGQSPVMARVGIKAPKEYHTLFRGVPPASAHTQIIPPPRLVQGNPWIL